MKEWFIMISMHSPNHHPIPSLSYNDSNESLIRQNINMVTNVIKIHER